MTNRFVLTCCLLVGSYLAAIAQVERTLHQTFLIDSLQTIQLQGLTHCQIVPWVSNSVLTETKVKIASASVEMLNYLEKLGRYQLQSQREGNTLTISAKDLSKNVLKSKSNDLSEQVTVKIYVPAAFEISPDATTLHRKRELD